MTRTAGIARLEKPAHPVILIHGFLGSKLRDPGTRKISWGTMANILTGGDSDALALPIDGGDTGTPGGRLVPYEIYDSLWGVEYYGKILKSLKTAGGYQLGDIDHPKPGDNAFVFIYDWRRDTAESARLLALAIERLRAGLGNPELRFDLLAHSQGGMIARYYVKYGGADVLEGQAPPHPTMAGAASVNKVIMLGTPNRGCFESLKILHMGVKKLFRPMRPEVVFTMPAVYQMLPPRGSAVLIDIEGSPQPLDPYDPQTWVTHRWSAFSEQAQARLRKKLGAEGARQRNERMREFLGRTLRRAERLHLALDAPDETDVNYYAFGSDCVPTLKTAILHEGEVVFDEEQLRDQGLADRAQRILYGPGDGKVLMQSFLSIPKEPGGVDFRSAFFVCDHHGVLPGNPIFQNNLFYVLLWQGAAREPTAQGHAATSLR